MNDEVIQLFKEQLKKITEEMRTYLASSGWHESIEVLMEKYQVPENMRMVFVTEISLVLFGILHPEGFRKELTDRLGGDDATFDMIVADIEEQLFKPIRPHLEYFFQIEHAQSMSEEERSAIRKDAEDKKRIDPSVRDAIKRAGSLREEAVMHKKRAEAELIVKTEAHNKSAAKSTLDEAQKTYNEAIVRQKTNRANAEEVQRAKSDLDISQQVYNASMVVIDFRNAAEMVKRAQDLERKATDAAQKIVQNSEEAIKKAGGDAIALEMSRRMPKQKPSPVVIQPKAPSQPTPPPQAPAPTPPPAPTARATAPQPEKAWSPMVQLSKTPIVPPPPQAPSKPIPTYKGPIYSHGASEATTEKLRTTTIEGKEGLDKIFDKTARQLAQNI